MVGVNPEFAHETMAGLTFYHAVAQALEAGKLFHIDLNGQKPGRYDQDFRFGQEDYKQNFFLVKLLEDYGYDGPKHFDAHPLRTSDPDDVWEFAKGCMRTYLIFKEKAAQFNADPEIQAILKETQRRGHDAGPDPVGQVHPAERAGAQGHDLRRRRPGRPAAALREAGPAGLRPAPRRPVTYEDTSICHISHHGNSSAVSWDICCWPRTSVFCRETFGGYATSG